MNDSTGCKASQEATFLQNALNGGSEEISSVVIQATIDNINECDNNVKKVAAHYDWKIKDLERQTRYAINEQHKWMDAHRSLQRSNAKLINEKTKFKKEVNAKCDKKIIAMQKKLVDDLQTAKDMVNRLIAGEQVGEDEQMSLFAQTENHYTVPSAPTRVKHSDEFSWELVRAYKAEVHELRQILNSRALVIEVDSTSITKRVSALEDENYKLKEKVSILKQKLSDESAINKMAENWALTEGAE